MRDPTVSFTEWKAVRDAVEEALPYYELISEIIAIGLARPLRRRAVERLVDSREEWVLDSGVGPGVSSRILLANGFERIVGVDPSLLLLRNARTKLNGHFYPVLAVAEHIPLRNGSIAGVISCYSLRDVFDRTKSVTEFARVIHDRGRLEIVDIGKPDNIFFRSFIELYITFAMPVIARFLIGGRRRANPFRMIIPTFHRLLTNQKLRNLIEFKFGSSTLHEFLFGGLVIVDAERRKDIEKIYENWES